MIEPSGITSAIAEVQPPTQQPGVEESDQLAALFSVDPSRSRFVIIFPGFRMGLKEDRYEQAQAENWLQVPEGLYRYRGKTSAMTAFGAVKGLIAMLSRIFDIDEIQNRVVLATDEQSEALLQEDTYTHFVMLGTRSHKYSRQILLQYSEDFEFRFEPEAWSIIDRRENKVYTVSNPSQMKPGQPVSGMDYALIEKIVDETTHRVIFVIGGMWDTGTLAAGNYLLEHRKALVERFGSGGFQCLLEVLPGTTQVNRILIERSPSTAALL